MTPAARIQTAIELLEAVESQSRPADRVVASGLRARRYAGWQQAIARVRSGKAP